MPDLQDILIGGMAIAPLVVALVALAKQLGMDTKYAPWLNGGLSVVLWLAATVAIPAYPVVGDIAKVIVGALVVFLGASGVYQFGKVNSNKK
jgi:hypothetical protein